MNSNVPFDPETLTPLNMSLTSDNIVVALFWEERTQALIQRRAGTVQHLMVLGSVLLLPLPPARNVGL
jgi:hypothetical protein